MEQTVSLKYMRAVQQLQKKKEELDEVFAAARKLDEENTYMKKETTELKRLVQQHEETAKTRNEELRFLEGQVRKLQQKLQFYIDEEIQKGSNSAKPSLSQVTAEDEEKRNELIKRFEEELAAKNSQQTELESKFKQAESKIVTLQEEKNAAVQSSEKYRKGADMLFKEIVSLRADHEKLQKEYERSISTVDELSRKESSLANTVKNLEKESMRVATETKEMDEVETKALEGLRLQLMVLSGENSKVLEQLHLEREAHTKALNEFAGYEEKLEKQRQLHQEQMSIVTNESSALTAHCEGILQDLKGVASDRDALEKELQEQKARTQKLLTDLSKATPPQGDHQLSPQRQGNSFGGSSPHAPLNSPKSSMRKRQSNDTKNETVQSFSIQKTEDASTMTDSDVVEKERQKKLGLEDEVKGLKRDLEQIIEECDTLKKLLHEKEATESLRKQKETFLQDEVAQLREDLLKQRQARTPLQKLVDGGLSSTSSSFLGEHMTNISSSSSPPHERIDAGIIDNMKRILSTQGEYFEFVVDRICEVLFKATKTMRIQQVAIDVLTAPIDQHRSKSTDSTVSDTSTTDEDGGVNDEGHHLCEEMLERHYVLVKELSGRLSKKGVKWANHADSEIDTATLLPMRKIDEHLRSLKNVISWLHRGTKKMIKPFRNKRRNNTQQHPTPNALPLHPNTADVFHHEVGRKVDPSVSARVSQQRHQSSSSQDRPHRDVLDEHQESAFVPISNQAHSYYEEVLGLSPTGTNSPVATRNNHPQPYDGSSASASPHRYLPHNASVASTSVESQHHNSLKDILDM